MRLLSQVRDSRIFAPRFSQATNRLNHAKNWRTRGVGIVNLFGIRTRNGTNPTSSSCGALFCPGAVPAAKVKAKRAIQMAASLFCRSVRLVADPSTFPLQSHKRMARFAPPATRGTVCPSIHYLPSRRVALRKKAILVSLFGCDFSCAAVRIVAHKSDLPLAIQMKYSPNQALEPTALAVMPPADAGVTPACGRGSA